MKAYSDISKALIRPSDFQLTQAKLDDLRVRHVALHDRVCAHVAVLLRMHQNLDLLNQKFTGMRVMYSMYWGTTFPPMLAKEQ